MALEDVVRQLQAENGVVEASETFSTQAVSDVDSYALEALGKLSESPTPTPEKTSGNALHGIRRGFASEQSLESYVGDYAASVAPDTVDFLRKGAPLLTTLSPILHVPFGTSMASPQMKSLGEQYGEDFYDLDPQGRRDRIINVKAQAVQEAFGEATGSISETVGEIGGSMAGLSSLLPFGRGISGAVKGGAIFGGADIAARRLAKEGEIDPVETVVGAAVGAAFAGTVEAAVVQPLARLVTNKRNQGGSLSTKEVEDALAGQDTTGGDLNDLTSRLNSQFRLDDSTNSPAIVKAVKDVRESVDISVEYPAVTDFEARMGEADAIIKGQGSTEFALPDFGTRKASQDYSLLTTKPKDRTKKSKEADLGLLEKMVNNADNWKKTRGAQKPNFGRVPVKEGSLTRKRNLQPDGEFLDRALAGQLQERQDALILLDKAVPKSSPIYSDLMQAVRHPQKGKKLSQNQVDAITTEQGWTPFLTRQYTINGVPGGDVYGVVAAKEVPWNSNIGKLLDKPIGNTASLNDQRTILEKMADGAVDWASNQLNVGDRLANMRTPAGRIANTLLTRAHAEKEYRVGSAVTGYIKDRNKLGIAKDSQEELLAASLLRGIVKPSQVSAEVRELANHVFKAQRSALREAKDLGIISAEDYAKFIKRADKKGYLSRVHDTDALRTPAGKAEFIKRLSQKALVSDSEGTALKKAQAIIEHLVPETEAANLLKQVNLQGDKAFIPANLAEILWKRYGVNTPNYRSRHLDAPRILPEEWEDVMEPFLVSNMEGLMASWSDDVFTRIEYARQFGGNDEVATKLYQELALENTEKANDFFQVYFTALGDPKSKSVRSFIEERAWVKNAVNKGKAFETYKLFTAAIPNLTQSPGNGLLYLLNQDGLPAHKATKIWADSIVKGVRAQFGNKELAYAADKFGATAQTIVLDATGGINEAAHTIFGRRFDNPLMEFINNPSFMLRTVQYFNVERLQRRMGHFMGEALAEDALERKARLLALGDRANPKHLRQVNRTLEELGIDTNLHPDDVTSRDKGLAGQYASNILNFTNDPKDSPLWTQTLWGKVFWQFKNFITKQTNFISKNVIKPAIRGNFKPLAAALTVVPGMGMGVDSTRRFLMGDDREFTMTERYLRGMLMVGVFGMMADVASQAMRGPLGLLGFAGGPLFGDASKVVHGAAKTGYSIFDPNKEADIKPLAKGVLGTAPPVPVLRPGLEQLLEEDSRKVGF